MPPGGGGKYEPECTQAMQASNAAACVLIILDGDRGSGFSISARVNVPPSTIASLLRQVATELDKQTV